MFTCSWVSDCQVFVYVFSSLIVFLCHNEEVVGVELVKLGKKKWNASWLEEVKKVVRK